jgi:hypothetical protein
MAKVRIHNEWFQPLSKTTCPCGCKKVEVIAWGEYVCGKWRTVDHFCRNCFQHRVLSRLLAHAKPCGCSFNFQARTGHSLPDFIKQAEGLCQAA